MALRLNIGCGPNIFPHEGWINYDREDMRTYLEAICHIDPAGMPEHQQRLAAYLTSGGGVDFRVHDVGAGFPGHEDGSVDSIYVGQMIEHLNPIYQAPQFLKECHRMLKPGGVLRMTTPDLHLLLDAYDANDMDKFAVEQPAFYKNADPSAQLAYLMFGAAGPACTQSHYEGHFFLYTIPSMKAALQVAGFGEVDFYAVVGESKDLAMSIEVVDAGMTHSFIVEAVR